MNNFWLHHIFAKGKGYGQFSLKHLILLFISVLFITFVVVQYKVSDSLTRILILRSIAIGLLICEITKIIVMAKVGVKVVDHLPLELCSFAGYFIMIDSIQPANGLFLEMLLTLFMPAAIMSLIFPTTSCLPMINYFTFQQFIFHTLIIAYVSSRFIAGEIALTYIGLWKSILIVITLALIIFIIDTIFDKNFFFLKGPYDNPLLSIFYRISKGGTRYSISLVIFSAIAVQFFFLLFKLIEKLIIK